MSYIMLPFFTKFLSKMVDWQDHAPRTVLLGLGVGFLLFVIHILLWLIDQVRICFSKAWL